MIEESGKHERAAKKAYEKALAEAGACDPLSVGYDTCQKKLEEAARNLLMWRETHRQALAGVQPEAE